ncbi:hypothetical protein TNCV_249801 [Trichonephila clavipes]|nr:hypothetical protein TNCV_249801 [Trichonephila clavipes]
MPDEKHFSTIDTSIKNTRTNNLMQELQKKFEDLCPLNENDLIEFMTAYDDKKVDNDEVEGVVKILTIDLIREGLKFSTSMEQHFLTCYPIIERALEFKRNHKFCVASNQEL